MARRAWTERELSFVADHPELTVRQVSEALGRGVGAVRRARAKLIGRPCWVDGCPGAVLARGLCEMHYRRLRRGQDMHSPRARRVYSAQAVCEVDGCEERPQARGLCGLHYGRLRATGSVELTQRPAKPRGYWASANKRKNDQSRAHAHHFHEQWTGAEMEVALRVDLSSEEVAHRLGRTIIAVRNMRRRLEYDGRVRIVAKPPRTRHRPSETAVL